MVYSHQEIEKKWQEYWIKNQSFFTNLLDKTKPKKYILAMFPYPSGSGLHVGHIRNYTITDALARFYRLNGYNVLMPIGWDAFGLPAEQYAIQNGNHPATFTNNNIEKFKKQLLRMGFSYDWSKEINTSEPDYYHWTQWIFKQIYLQKLAEYKEIPVYWCKELGTVLANEEIKLVDGQKVSERGSYPVVQKSISQWVLKITNYAEQLLTDLQQVDWPNSIKSLQTNWIGLSKGTIIDFPVIEKELVISVFTTRPDTIYGVVAITLSINHQLINEITLPEHQKKVTDFCTYWATEKESKEIAGEFTGSYCVNPLTKEKIPVWITNFVISDYGTGAVMIAPFFDKERDYLQTAPSFFTLSENKQNKEIDFAFAQKYNLPIKKIFQINLAKENQKSEVIEKKYWIGVVSKEHALVGMKEGFLQVCHGKETPLKKMKTGDMFIFYSSKDNFLVKEPYQKFTGLGKITNSKVYQVDMGGGFKPFRIDAEFIDCQETSILPLIEKLTFIKNKKKWGYQFLSGYCEISKEDFKLLAENMKVDLNKLAYDSEKEGKISDHNYAYINSPLTNSLTNNKQAIESINNFLVKEGKGKIHNNYHLRDWIFSRQRYWGEPIPVIHWENGEQEILKGEQLPLKLPPLTDFAPSPFYYSPLQKVNDWVNVKREDEKFGKRDINVMPQWAGSCWYYIAFLLKKNDTYLALNSSEAKEIINSWLPVDLYIGGQEHANLHLLYARFWHKVLAKIGIVSQSEPFQKLLCQGMILGADGEKMSKSRGNIINPNELVEKYGADALRLYEVFLGPPEQTTNFDPSGVRAMKKWLDRVYNFFLDYRESVLPNTHNQEIEVAYQEMILKSTEHYKNIKLNLVVSSLMTFINKCYKVSAKFMPLDCFLGFLKILNPLAPHISEEMWSYFEVGKKSIVDSDWPQSKKIQIASSQQVNIVVQINGQKKTIISVNRDESQGEIEKIAKNDPKISKTLEGQKINKAIFIKNKLINFVI